MARLRLLPFVLLLSGLASSVSAAEVAPASDSANKSKPPADGFIALFDGKTLAGWEGAPGWWDVRDGILVGESTPAKPCERSHYLYCKDREPADFDLRAVYRISGEANSGIQFRSERRPHWDTWGYQADLDTAGQYTGCLYQHDRGLVAERGQSVLIDADGTKTIKVVGDSRELLKAARDRDWNTYRILAEGPRITLWINDVMMCQVEDRHEKLARARGIIALQMHQGPPMKIEFKEIRIRILD